MPYRLIWLADVLRAASLTVQETDGWQIRGHGDFGVPRGALLHHTAGAPTGDMPSLPTVIHGRSDLPGPLCNLALSRSGIWYTVAAGKAWHAGAGLWASVSDGNGQLIGIEAENTGLPDDPWPEVQMTSYICGVAALLDHIGAPTIMAVGHKEFALPKGRKVDPSFDMGVFRLEVDNARASKEKPLTA